MQLDRFPLRSFVGRSPFDSRRAASLGRGLEGGCGMVAVPSPMAMGGAVTLGHFATKSQSDDTYGYDQN